MNRIVLICLLLALSNLILDNAIASVTVTMKQEVYEFTYEPYVSEVLALIADQEKWYWPSAVLYQADSIQLENTREQVLNSLSTLIKSHQIDKPEISHSLEQLKITITQWDLAQRLPLKIDYDLVRIVAKANPRLPKGQYILSVTPRMSTVQLYGAVHETSNIAHRPHTDVSQYITNIARTNLADKDYVIIIQANGQKITAPIAYWNKGHQEIMPSSQLFIPFRESFFYPEFAILNQHIITLALNRVR